jgi:hypothetical protein
MLAKQFGGDPGFSAASRFRTKRVRKLFGLLFESLPLNEAERFIFSEINVRLF